LSYTQLFAGINLNFAGFTTPLNKMSTIGVGLVNLNSGDIELTTIDQPQGTGENYTNSNLLAGVSYARRLTDRFILGVTVKYIEEKLYH